MNDQLLRGLAEQAARELSLGLRGIEAAALVGDIPSILDLVRAMSGPLDGSISVTAMTAVSAAEAQTAEAVAMAKVTEAEKAAAEAMTEVRLKAIAAEEATQRMAVAIKATAEARAAEAAAMAQANAAASAAAQAVAAREAATEVVAAAVAARDVATKAAADQRHRAGCASSKSRRDARAERDQEICRLWNDKTSPDASDTVRASSVLKQLIGTEWGSSAPLSRRQIVRIAGRL